MTKKAFSIHYNLKNADGVVVDTSMGGPPLEFVEGDGSIVRGLEMALLQREAGDIVSVTVPPELAYGNVDEGKVFQVPLTSFDNHAQIKPGMLCQTHDREQTSVVKILDVRDNMVLVDANHPLAGFALHFEVEILSIKLLD